MGELEDELKRIIWNRVTQDIPDQIDEQISKAQWDVLQIAKVDAFEQCIMRLAQELDRRAGPNIDGN